jgi:hypothetical protein
VTDTGKIGDPAPPLRVWYDTDTGAVLGWVISGNYASGRRFYNFENVTEEDVPGFPTGYTVDDEHGWARLIRLSDGAVIDVEDRAGK